MLVKPSKILHFLSVFLSNRTAFYTILSPAEVLGSEAVAVTFANRCFGMFSFAIPSNLNPELYFSQIGSMILINLFLIFFSMLSFHAANSKPSSLCCPLNIRRCERYSANIVAIVLRWCGRRTNAGNSHHVRSARLMKHKFWKMIILQHPHAHSQHLNYCSTFSVGFRYSVSRQHQLSWQFHSWV